MMNEYAVIVKYLKIRHSFERLGYMFTVLDHAYGFTAYNNEEQHRFSDLEVAQATLEVIENARRS